MYDTTEKIACFPSDRQSGNGKVTASAFFCITDFSGNTRQRRVRIGTEYSVNRETAKSMADNIRKGNPDIGVRVTYSEEL